MDHISVCALVPYSLDTTPSQRYRIEQWTPYLESRGIKVDLIPFVDDRLMTLLHKPGHRAAKAIYSAVRFGHRIADILRTRRYDAVLIHRAACIGGPAFPERLAAITGRPLIFDFDDAIFKLHTSEANRRFGWLKFPGKTASICRLSRHVIVGNSWLAEYAHRFNQNVTIIPTSIDTQIYQPVQRDREGGPVVIGWTGSSTSQAHLEMFAPVLRELVSSRAVELHIISDRPPSLPGLKFNWQPWTSRTEVDALSRFDIGIMPMPDDEWSRGKCAAKALQYMAMGIPTICSAVGANCDVVKHGENGLLASNSGEWISGLQQLVDRKDLRDKLGVMGRRTVETNYSMTRCAELFGAVVRDVLKEERRDQSNSDNSIVGFQSALK